LRGEVVGVVKVEPSPCGEGATALDRADGGFSCEEFLLLGFKLAIYLSSASIKMRSSCTRFRSY